MNRIEAAIIWACLLLLSIAGFIGGCHEKARERRIDRIENTLTNLVR